MTDNILSTASLRTIPEDFNENDAIYERTIIIIPYKSPDLVKQIEAAYEKNGFFIDSFKNVIAHPVAHIHFNFSMDVSSYMERYGYNGYKAVYTLSEEEFEKLKNKFKKFASDLHSAGYYFTRFKFAAYHPFDDRGELYPKYCEYIVKAWKDEPEPLTPGWKRAVAEPPPFLTLQQAFNNFELIE